MVTRIVSDSEVRRLQSWLQRLVVDRGAGGRGEIIWQWRAPVVCSAPACVAVACMLEAGLRVGELRCLSVGSMCQARGRPRWIEVFASMAKRHRGRRVPVSRFLADVLEAGFRAWRAAWRGPLEPTLAQGDWPWMRVSTRTLERVVKRVGQVVLDRPIIPHALRHTYATRLLRVSDLKTVQECLGHARIGTTERYLHVSSDDLTRAAAALDVVGRH